MASFYYKKNQIILGIFSKMSLKNKMAYEDDRA